MGIISAEQLVRAYTTEQHPFELAKYKQLIAVSGFRKHLSVYTGFKHKI